MPTFKSYILWYNSRSHGKTRYFVGSGQQPCKTHGFHVKPMWTDDKHAATILDGNIGQQAKKFAEACGYKGLILEPIDETPTKSAAKTTTH